MNYLLIINDAIMIAIVIRTGRKEGLAWLWIEGKTRHNNIVKKIIRF